MVVPAGDRVGLMTIAALTVKLPCALAPLEPTASTLCIALSAFGATIDVATSPVAEAVIVVTTVEVVVVSYQRTVTCSPAA